MNDNDWAAIEMLFGRETMLKAKAEYAAKTAERRAQARREHRQRIAVALTFYALSAVFMLGAIHGFILLMIAAYDGVTGTP